MITQFKHDKLGSNQYMNVLYMHNKLGSNQYMNALYMHDKLAITA